MDDEVNKVTKNYEAFLENISWGNNEFNAFNFSIKNKNFQSLETTLENTGQSIIRFPGKRNIKIVGFLINNEIFNEYTIFSENQLKIQMILKSRSKQNLLIGYRIAIFDLKGNCIGVIESEGDKKYLNKNEVFDVFIYRKNLGLKEGNYFLSIAIEKYELRSTTTNPEILREDFLYKSFKLIVKNSTNKKLKPFVELDI